MHDLKVLLFFTGIILLFLVFLIKFEWQGTCLQVYFKERIRA